MQLTVIQIILLTLLAWIKQTDWATLQVTAFNTIFYGMVAGIICGDMQTGLAVGATMQLMSMGLVAVGGSSMPDYPVAAIIATAISITTNRGIEAGLAIGLPVAMLGVQFDVIFKIFNGFLARKEQEYCNNKEFKKMLRTILLSPIFYGACAGIPVFISVALGPTVINSILEFMPAWFTSGLSIAGGLLPAVGICMLLMYMPTKKYISFLLIGFVLAAYIGVPILGIAIVGLAGAYEVYKSGMNQADGMSLQGGLEDE